MQDKITELRSGVYRLRFAVYCQTVGTITLLVCVGLNQINQAATINTATGGNVTINDNQPATKHQDFFTASEYARHTNQSLETIYRKCQSGALSQAIKVDGHWRIYKK